MWWYYDLVVIAVLVLCIWNGMRRSGIDPYCESIT